MRGARGQCPDAGAETGTPRSPGIQKSLKFISRLQMPLPSLQGWKTVDEIPSPPQAVPGAPSPRCSLTPPTPVLAKGTQAWGSKWSLGSLSRRGCMPGPLPDIQAPRGLG